MTTMMPADQPEHWFVMDARAIYDTDEASVIWSAGNKRPSKRELRDFAGQDSCLCVQRGDSMEFVELI